MLVAASHGAGPAPAATLPSTPRAAVATTTVADEPSAAGGSDQARAGYAGQQGPADGVSRLSPHLPAPLHPFVPSPPAT